MLEQFNQNLGTVIVKEACSLLFAFKERKKNEGLMKLFICFFFFFPCEAKNSAILASRNSRDSL